MSQRNSTESTRSATSSRVPINLPPIILHRLTTVSEGRVGAVVVQDEAAMRAEIQGLEHFIKELGYKIANPEEVQSLGTGVYSQPT